MTVKELIEKLQEHDPDRQVYVYGYLWSNFNNSKVAMTINDISENGFSELLIKT